MEVYKIVSSNLESALPGEVNKFIKEGYIPIGRSFVMFKCYWQTMLHKSAIEKLDCSTKEFTDKYIIVISYSEGSLMEKVNKHIEDGYMPAGRMYLDGSDYKQTMIHCSLLTSLEVFTNQVIIEGSQLA